MITIPFIYFSFLSFFFYRKHKQIDLATILSLMFAVSGCFSVLIDICNLRTGDTERYEISWLPAFLYCFLLTLCIFPISAFPLSRNLRLNPIKNVKLLKGLSVIALFWFLAFLVLAKDDIMRVLLGDMGDIRKDLYAGIAGEHWMMRLSGPIRVIFACLNITFSCPWTLIFLGFYTIISNNISRTYSYFFFLSSLSGPFNGIIGADRSQVAYWIISLMLIYWLFKPHLPKSVKRRLNVLGLVVLGGLVLYLASMTISRFENDDNSGGPLGSLYVYLGQPYINFCYFFDNYELPFQHWGIVFPAISQFIFGIKAGGTLIQQQMSLLSGKFTGVFYTFIGHLMIGVGQITAAVLTFIYALLSTRILYKIKKRKAKGVDSVFLFFAISSVVALGLFGHYYAGVGNALGVFFMYLIIRLL